MTAAAAASARVPWLFSLACQHQKQLTQNKERVKGLDGGGLKPRCVALCCCVLFYCAEEWGHVMFRYHEVTCCAVILTLLRPSVRPQKMVSAVNRDAKSRLPVSCWLSSSADVTVNAPNALNSLLLKEIWGFEAQLNTNYSQNEERWA